ncbi:hypothetical protein, partial [Haematobacter massiliensis]|uniref:hypothetical protein n=2 Tax=Haematobacter massiliensis TaxID=195105 RepID=UPI000B700C18
MRKITSLTKDQEDALPRFREECRSIALASPVVTDDEMRAAVIRLYASRGLKEPAVFVFADPTQCLWARAILRNAAKKGLGGQIGVQLRDQLMGQLGGQLWDQLGFQLRDQLMGQLGGQ